MENKYYQPNAEDFNIGVECQVYYPREEVWKDRKIRHCEDLNEILSRFITDNTSVRFKYLDEDDILDCVFVKSKEDKMEIIYKRPNSNFGIYFYTDYRRKVLIYSDVCDYEGCIFDGYIKNKNELQKLLIQLEND